MRHAHAVCSFLPPHILRKIAENADGDLRERAHATLEASAQMRGERAIVARIAGELAIPAGEKHRTIYDARRGRALPGHLVLSEGADGARDSAVDEAYEGAGKAYDFYRRVLARNSVDDRGLRLDATVHYSVDFDNAQWNGRQMIFGDGDGLLFNRFTKFVDIIGHELTHAVTQYTASLEYSGQSGALNESFSDVFGVLVKQHALKHTASKADWLVGAGLFTKRVNGHAVRSMRAPGTAYDDRLIGKDPQPSHMHDYKRMSTDNGGVHINSGIPNHAFYRLATLLGGKAWEEPGQIWYGALTRKLHSRSNFRHCADATFEVAGELYGKGSAPQLAVVEAWKAVGIEVSRGVVAEGPRLQVREYIPPAAAAELPQLRLVRKPPRVAR